MTNFLEKVTGYIKLRNMSSDLNNVLILVISKVFIHKYKSYVKHEVHVEVPSYVDKMYALWDNSRDF